MTDFFSYISNVISMLHRKVTIAWLQFMRAVLWRPKWPMTISLQFSHQSLIRRKSLQLETSLLFGFWIPSLVANYLPVKESVAENRRLFFEWDLSLRFPNDSMIMIRLWWTLEITSHHYVISLSAVTRIAHRNCVRFPWYEKNIMSHRLVLVQEAIVCFASALVF